MPSGADTNLNTNVPEGNLGGRNVESGGSDLGGSRPSGAENSSIVFVDSNGVGIEAQQGSVFRANAVTPEIDASITQNGFLTGQTRGVTPDRGAALSSDSSIEDRVVQFVEGRPFPRDSNFVGFREIPHDSLDLVVRTQADTLSQPGAVIRLDEVNLDNFDTIEVDRLFSETLNRPPRAPLDVVGEVVVEGDVPASAILNTTRIEP